MDLEDDDEDELVEVKVVAEELEMEGSDCAVEDEDEVMESGLRSEQLAARVVLESLSE
jgi:hypothetical protein